MARKISAKSFYQISDAKRREMFSKNLGGEVRGNLKEWKSVYGPGAPFAGGHEQEAPCHALKVGIHGPDATRKGANKNVNQ